MTTMTKLTPMFANMKDFAQLFTPVQPAGKHLDGGDPFVGTEEAGLKPIEAFSNDIHQNLVKWASLDTYVFYDTGRFIYELRLDDDEDDLVWMTRFTKGTTVRVDSWANAHSLVHLGKWWLNTQPEKRVPIVPE